MRNWFQFLDADGSGEIGVDELQDPLVSVGLASCRDDVVNLIHSVDKSGHEEIDFEAFMQLIKPKRDSSKISSLPTGASSPRVRGSRDSEGGGATPSDNPVIKLFENLKKGTFGSPKLPLPILITAYRRRMLLNANMSKDVKLKKQGQAVISAIGT